MSMIQNRVQLQSKRDEFAYSHGTLILSPAESIVAMSACPVPGADAGVSVGQEFFDLASSLPQGLPFQQALNNSSRSAPHIMSMPDGLLSSDLLFGYKAPQQNGQYPRKHSLGSDKAVDLYPAPLTR